MICTLQVFLAALIQDQFAGTEVKVRQEFLNLHYRTLTVSSKVNDQYAQTSLIIELSVLY
jgi:hypothetical protein